MHCSNIGTMETPYSPAERIASWKVCLPASGRVWLAEDRPDAVCRSMSRSFERTDVPDRAEIAVLSRPERFTPALPALRELAYIVICRAPLSWSPAADAEFETAYRLIPCPDSSMPRLFLNAATPADADWGLQWHCPGSRKMRLLTALIRMSCRMGILAPFFRSSVLILRRKQLPQQDLLNRLTAPGRKNFAVYTGSDAPERKWTLFLENQTPDGKSGFSILKLADTAAGAMMLERETELLRTLNRTALAGHIPSILDSGRCAGWSWQKQSAPDPRGLRYCAGYTADVRAFYHKMSQVNADILPLKQLPLYGKMMNAPIPQEAERGWRFLADHESEPMPCHVFHGDFAPWNCRAADHGLWCYDWEAGENQAPRALDLFHWAYQTTVLLKRWPGFPEWKERAFLPLLKGCDTGFSRVWWVFACVREIAVLGPQKPLLEILQQVMDKER